MGTGNYPATGRRHCGEVPCKLPILQSCPFTHCVKNHLFWASRVFLLAVIFYFRNSFSFWLQLPRQKLNNPQSYNEMLFAIDNAFIRILNRTFRKSYRCLLVSGLVPELSPWPRFSFLRSNTWSMSGGSDDAQCFWRKRTFCTAWGPSWWQGECGGGKVRWGASNTWIAPNQ